VLEEPPKSVRLYNPNSSIRISSCSSFTPGGIGVGLTIRNYCFINDLGANWPAYSARVVLQISSSVQEQRAGPLRRRARSAGTLTTGSLGLASFRGNLTTAAAMMDPRSLWKFIVAGMESFMGMRHCFFLLISRV